MLRPIRRHVQGCGNHGKWDVECPPKTKPKCPLIVVRYEMGPGGRKIRKERSLKTNDESVAWELINRMVVNGETTPAEPPKTVRACIDDYLKHEANRGIGESTLKSFRKFLCGNLKRNPNGHYSPTLLEFAAKQNPPIEYLKDFNFDSVSTFRGEWKVKGGALKIQSERLKQFFKSCLDFGWIPENPAANLKAPKVKQTPVYAFPKADRDALLNAVSGDNFLLALNLTMRYSALAPVDLVFLKPQNLHGDRIVTKRKKTDKRVNVKLPPVVVERLKALPVQAGGYWFWNRKEKNSKHETATGNLRRMMRPYFADAKVYQKDEHGEIVYETDLETQAVKPVLGTLYQWRHTFVHEHIMKDTPPSRIAEFLGDTIKTVMETYAHFIEERQSQLDAAAEKNWNQEELEEYRKR
jgi:integrase